LGILQREDVRQVEIKREDHTLRTVILVATLILIIIFSVDARNSIQKEMHRLEV
jgi:hypothetical protein